MNIETQLNGNYNRRMANEAKFLNRVEKLEMKAAEKIGEIVRDGCEIYYINLLDRNGNFTGKIKESHSHTELTDYLIRNKYVS